MPSKYTFAEYSDDWPREFELEADRLRTLLDDALIVIHHVGSTSVPGLPSKPIIDLLPVAREISTIDDFTPMLQDAGYKAWGEYGLPGRRYFTKDREQDREQHRTHNIHIYQDGDVEIERHLAFCWYLRHNEPARDQYAWLKRWAYADHPADIDAYNNSKNEWIKSIEPMAIELYRECRVNQ